MRFSTAVFCGVTLLLSSAAHAHTCFFAKMPGTIQQIPDDLVHREATASLTGTTVNPWQAPSDTDKRSPCPGLNTLANHGYINHNGLDITAADIANGLVEVYNFEPGFASGLAAQSLGAFNATSIDLYTLGKHGLIEHDVSLTRNDFNDEGTDAYTFQEELWEELASQSQDGTTLTWQDFAYHIKNRIAEEKSSDTKIVYGEVQAQAGYAAVSFVTQSFGDFVGQTGSLDIYKVLWNEERISEDWVRPTNQFTLQQFGDSGKTIAALVEN
eukprot:TRINITY_DN624_c0_g1_i2.p1 TRINITY_DN624_c0_g1~~TRINITY_DN624_c0_g1_i2.p1  ORF type:complete len:270 (+),score=72.65 TRINITY_DN624_c0_g1_i2:92-901(+)